MSFIGGSTVYTLYSLLSIIQDGWTALMKASENGHTDVVKVLVEAKADLNITDKVNLMMYGNHQ